MSAGVSIVIVTFNAREDALACLASVHAHPPGRAWDVIVVDNRSADGTADAVAARWPSLPLRRLPANVGFAAANNIGIRATTQPYVLLLNSDTLVDDADFSIFVRAYDILDCSDPAMPLVCPSDLNRDGLVDDADFQVFVVAYDELLCP